MLEEGWIGKGSISTQGHAGCKGMGRRVKGKHRNTRTLNASLPAINDSTNISLKYSVDKNIVNFLLLLFGHHPSISQEDST